MQKNRDIIVSLKSKSTSGMSYWISSAKRKISISHKYRRAQPSHWITMTEANSNSEYNNLLEALRNRRKNEAKTEIPKFCDALRNEDPKISPAEIRKKVERDMQEFWALGTIRNNLPDEYKEKAKQDAGIIAAEVKKEKKEMVAVIGESAHTVLTEPNPVEQKEPDSRTFTTEQTHIPKPYVIFRQKQWRDKYNRDTSFTLKLILDKTRENIIDVRPMMEVK